MIPLQPRPQHSVLSVLAKGRELAGVRASWLAVNPSVARAIPSGLIPELVHFLELVACGARQLDAPAGLVDLKAFVGHRNEPRPDAKKPTDLQDGEQHLLLID